MQRTAAQPQQQQQKIAALCRCRWLWALRIQTRASPHKCTQDIRDVFFVITFRLHLHVLLPTKCITLGAQTMNSSDRNVAATTMTSNDVENIKIYILEIGYIVAKEININGWQYESSTQSAERTLLPLHTTSPHNSHHWINVRCTYMWTILLATMFNMCVWRFNVCIRIDIAISHKTKSNQSRRRHCHHRRRRRRRKRRGKLETTFDF